jgi:hypothetical protein
MILLSMSAATRMGLGAGESPKAHTVQGLAQAGPIVIGNGKDRSKKEAEVRDFLWTRWRQHRSGRLLAIWISKEGSRATTSYTLESDRNRTWTLKVKTSWPTQSGAASEHDRVQFTVYAIRRIEPRRDGQSAAVFIPEGESLPGDEYWLVFYGKDGKEIGGV